MRKRIFLFSHIGNSRENHEDNYILHKRSFLTVRARKYMEKGKEVFCSSCKNKGKDFLVAVSDGMGGHSSGEVASLLTVKYLSKNYKKIIHATDISDLKDTFLKLNRHIVDFAKKNSECKNMGATVCGLICKNQKTIGFNIGDSRVYHFVNGQLKQLSVDHTEGQRLLNLNLLNEDEIKNFPRRKHLYKYIGLNGELVADIFEIDNCEQDSIFLLCSDGLTDVLSNSEIEEILKRKIDIHNKGKVLINEAVKRNVGFGDNITVILIDSRKEETNARRRNIRISHR